MKYYARGWNESRGDAYDHWGPATYYFEVGDDDWPVRQVEVYDHGPTLRHDLDHLDDEFGGLSEVPLDPVEFAPFAISHDDFEHVWVSIQAS